MARGDGLIGQINGVRKALKLAGDEARRVGTHFESTRKKIENLADFTGQNMFSGLTESLNGTVQEVSAARGQIEQQVNEAGQLGDQLRERLDISFQDARGGLDDLLFLVQDLPGVVADQVYEAIGYIEDGSLSVNDFLRVFGDTTIQVGDDIVRIKEFLTDLTTGKEREGFDDFVDGIRGGTETVDSLLKELEQQNNKYAAALADIIGKFQQGEVSANLVLQQIERILEILKGTGSETADLARDLEDAILNGGI